MDNNTQLTTQNPNDLLAQAIEKGLDVESLGKLMALQERWEANQARKSFFEAFTKFQSTCPEIRKSKNVAFKEVKYNYAPLSDITRQISDHLEKNQLSYRWEIQDTEKEIQVTCLISHIDGHTERTTMMASPDTTGSKNVIQARGSAIEYLKRYTLIGALGLSTTDSDVDGQMPEIDLDILHAQYMVHYNSLIQLDSSYTRVHPDNWKGDKNAKLYIKAIGEIRKLLAEKAPKKA